MWRQRAIGCGRKPCPRSTFRENDGNGKLMKKNAQLWNSIYFIFSILVFSLWVFASVEAQSSSNFFAGKTITFLAGSSAGGGTDLTARLIARHLERYIPGHPRVMVVNKPGAGGMIAANELYNLKKADGLSMSTINTGA